MPQAVATAHPARMLPLPGALLLLVAMRRAGVTLLLLAAAAAAGVRVLLLVMAAALVLLVALMVCGAVAAWGGARGFVCRCAACALCLVHLNL